MRKVAFRLSLSLLALGLGPLAAAGQSGAATSEAQDSTVVAVLDGGAITLDEFERRYARSVGGREAAAQDSLEAYQDFLERYVNFRLKVRAAEEAGMGADSALQGEIAQYRANLARPYLLEQEVLDPIIRDLYERKGQVVDASHILIQVGPDAAPEDTLAAYNRIAALVDSVEAGQDFGEVAARYSEDPSAQRPAGPGSRGRLGYFTAGQMVAPFEDAAFAAAPGERSEIFRTQFGYHVLQVHDRRAAPPDVRVSHLLIRPADSTAAAIDSARALADSVRSQIASGADFAELTRHSTDPRSAQAGGDLGMIAYNDPRFPPLFKDAAFALEEVGDVTDVLDTPYGYLILKLTERAERATYEAAYQDLKQEVAQMPRTREAEAAFAEQALQRRGSTLDTAAVLSPFEGLPADSVFITLVSDTLAGEVMGRQVAAIGDSTYTLRDVAQFAVGARVPRADSTRAQVLALMEAFLQDRVLDYEAAALEERDEEFRIVMEEFRDGLLLFKLMEDSVWTAAAQDTAALEAYFEEHRDRYQYGDRVRVVGLYGASDSLLAATSARLDSTLTLAALADELAADSLAPIRIDTTMVTDSTGSLYDQALTLETGERTEPIPYRGGYVVLVRDGDEAARPMTFEEALSRTIADYQEVLEARMLARLRERYGVETYPGRLEGAFSGVAATSAGAASDASGG